MGTLEPIFRICLRSSSVRTPSSADESDELRAVVGKLNVLTAFLDGGPLKSLIEKVQDSNWYV